MSVQFLFTFTNDRFILQKLVGCHITTFVSRSCISFNYIKRIINQIKSP